ncbi:hypothetical protein FGM00_13495 [Aggregatimonas sangjinii]|uniref:Uncharacterized protein n=1 Tax=Aggregatimonas sangjinii TaxID=2583587 RepID=A0A5B7SUW8_9FLAO|nr:hypothetical protein [Aggregatimonas sangjinii]QCX01079.1 hypothetical protein FGM00_13495 [Aggregatimonas sangjinii]
MMKTKNIYISALIGLVLLTACESDDKVVQQVLDGKTSGAVLRERAISGEEDFDIFRDETEFSVTLEEQDEDNGELIDRVDFTISFVDNNKEGATGDDTVDPIAFGTIPASEFTIGDRGLPVADFSFTMAEALETLGVPLTEVLPGDRIQLDFTLFFTDGRSFNANDAAVTVTGGSFFSSPFSYSLLVDDGIAFDYEVTTSDEIDLSDGAINENYQVDISIDDESEGSLIETLNIYRTFRDLTIGEDGTDLSEEEALFETYNIADLDLEEGARILSLDYSLDMIFGDELELEDLSVGDDFQFRYEIITEDGRIVTTDEKDTEYFYTIATSECILLNGDAPFPGEYTVKLTDLYGDGWDGAFIEVTIDGGDPQVFTIETGEESEGTFTVPEGATSLLVTYTNGLWEDEHVYEIIDPNGKKAAVGGPFERDNAAPPVAREVELKVCE